MAIPSTVKALECIGLVTPWGYIYQVTTTHLCVHLCGLYTHKTIQVWYGKPVRVRMRRVERESQGLSPSLLWHFINTNALPRLPSLWQQILSMIVGWGRLGPMRAHRSTTGPERTYYRSGRFRTICGLVYAELRRRLVLMSCEPRMRLQLVEWTVSESLPVNEKS